VDAPFTVSELPASCVMGVVNVTPDSFSDGGRHAVPDAAVAHALGLAAEGAHLLDVGGESTRPGAEPVAVDEELARVVPVVERLAAATDVPISIDTSKAAVAGAALDAGAALVNDVTAGRSDERMLDVVAEHGAGIVLMHMQGEPRTMQHDPRYDDVVAEVGAFLAERRSVALAAGIRADAVLVDPGIGFGKTTAHNLALLAGLPDLVEHVGAPVVIGASRKAFLGRLGGAEPADARDDATLATTVWAFEHGVRVVRVHEVAASARAARMLDVVHRATPEGLVA
jgi:dihydropteroate synthase